LFIGTDTPTPLYLCCISAPVGKILLRQKLTGNLWKFTIEESYDVQLGNFY